MRIFLNKFIIFFLLLTFFIEAKVRADDNDSSYMNEDKTSLYLQSITHFSRYYLTPDNLKNPRIRTHLQTLFIDEILLDWIKKNKVVPTRKNLKSKYYKEFGLLQRNLVNTQDHDTLGLFESFKDLREKVIKRIDDLNLSSEYSFIFYFSFNDNFTINLKDLEDPQKRHKLQIQVIDRYILPWIDKHKEFPCVYDFHRREDGVGILYKDLFSSHSQTTKNHRIGIFDSMRNLKSFLYARIKELGLESKYYYLTDKNYVTHLLTSKDLNNPIVKEQAQKAFIRDRIIPWITEKNKFPEYVDFRVPGDYIGGDYYRVFRPSTHNPSLFNNIYELKKMTEELIIEEELDKTNPNILDIFNLEKSLDANKLSSKKYVPQDNRYPVQKAFILKYILPWIEKYNKIPEIIDFGIEEGKVGISHFKIFPLPHNRQALFDSMYDLRKKIYLIFQELNLKELRDSLLEQILLSEKITRTELEDENIRQLLQSICIKKYILPWMNLHNGALPTVKDFGLEDGDVGLSYTKVFGGKRSNVFKDSKCLFKSMSELKEKVDIIIGQNKLKEYDYSSKNNTNTKDVRPLDFPISQKDLNISERRAILQKILIKEYILPWVHRHQGAIPTEINFGTGPDQIGLDYDTVFGKKLDDDEQLLGIFDSMDEIKKELMGCITLFIENIED